MITKMLKWYHFWIKYIVFNFLFLSSKRDFNWTCQQVLFFLMEWLEYHSGSSALKPAGPFTPSAMPVHVMEKKGFSFSHLFMNSTGFFIQKSSIWVALGKESGEQQKSWVGRSASIGWSVRVKTFTIPDRRCKSTAPILEEAEAQSSSTLHKQRCVSWRSAWHTVSASEGKEQDSTFHEAEVAIPWTPHSSHSPCVL